MASICFSGVSKVFPNGTDVRVGVGDRLRLAVDMTRLHVFDPETGLALR